MSKPIESQSVIAKENEKKANRDPITGEPGMHAVGTAVGAAVAGGATAIGVMATGAALGSAAGPAGAIIGATIGAVVGANVGKAVGEEMNPTQLVWWEENYKTRPYIKPGQNYSTYEPAYRSGIEAASASNGRAFNELEPDMKNDWHVKRGDSQLEWDQARPAAEDAFVKYTTYKPESDKR